MSDAARQRADRLHLLRLPQLRFQSFPFHLSLLLSCHVHGRSDEAIRPTRLVPQAAAPRKEPAPVAVTDAIFAFKTRRAALEMISHGEFEARLVIGVDVDSREP